MDQMRSTILDKQPVDRLDGVLEKVSRLKGKIKIESTSEVSLERNGNSI